MSDAERSRVCITGSGVASALGFSLPDTLGPLAEGQTGVRPAQDLGRAPLVPNVAAVPEPYLRATVPPELESELRFLNPSGQLALNAVAEAIETAEALGLDMGALAADRKSLYLAQVDAGDWDCHDFQKGFKAAGDTPLSDMPALNKQASRRTKPTFLLESLKNNVFSFVAKWITAMGPNTGVAGLSHAGFQALDIALRSIQRGSIDMAMVVGTSVLSNPVARLEFGGRDAEREGKSPLVPGDGAGALVLESLDAVTARGAEPLGILLGMVSATGPAGDGGPVAETVRYVAEAAIAASGREHIDLVVVPQTVGVSERALQDLPALSGGKTVCWRESLGHIGAATEAVEVAMACAVLKPGEAALIVSAGFYGPAGAIVVARPGTDVSAANG